jgi:hypothetical protein
MGIINDLAQAIGDVFGHIPESELDYIICCG